MATLSIDINHLGASIFAPVTVGGEDLVRSVVAAMTVMQTARPNRVRSFTEQCEATVHQHLGAPVFMDPFLVAEVAAWYGVGVAFYRPAQSPQ